MKIEDFKAALSDTFKTSKVKDGVFKIETGASFLNNQPIVLVLEQKENKWFLTDGKSTLKYMNELYELKSEDVKTCIKNVLKIYNFSMQSAMIVTEIETVDTFVPKFFDMISCIGQLANMFAFFDKP